MFTISTLTLLGCFHSSVDLRAITGHTGSEDIEIRALWSDAYDNLVFAGSSWGNDQSRGTNLPAFFILELNTSPIIHAPPVSVVTSPRREAGFAVTALGAAPLSYQWQRDGTNLAGQTNAQLPVTSATVSNVGAYRVLVGNSYGTNASPSASLSLLSLTHTGAPVLNLVGSVGGNYRLEYQDNLQSAVSWSNLVTVSLSNMFFLLTDTSSPPQRFYRAVPLPP